MPIQRDVLNALLDKYENSLTYSGENRVNQSFSLSPEKVYPAYLSNYEPIDNVHAFEDRMKQLEREGLVSLRFSQSGISKIILVPEKTAQAYARLGRQEKKAIRDGQAEFFRSALGDNPVGDALCREQLNRLAAGKKPLYEMEDARVLLSLVSAIWHNETPLLERELSIRLFSDSKTFEKSYRTRVFNIFEKYGDYEDLLKGIDDKREREKVLFEEYNIFANPSYIYMKGRGQVTFADGTSLEIPAGKPLALSSTVVPDIVFFDVRDGTIMTVENLTSYNRIALPDTFFLYLAGYHNTVKKNLIRRIAADNPGASWLHFGDIDPDGFLIADNLAAAAGLDIGLYRMDIAELERYASFTKPLEKNDIVKANHLLSAGRHTEVLSYMLSHNVKLEQEIVQNRIA